MSPSSTFELILGLLALALILPIVARRLPIPQASTLVLGGMALALLPWTLSVELDPDLIMVMFLPPLLMSGAYFTVWRDFKADLTPIALLALGAVAFTTFVVGYAAKLMLPGLPWAACFTLGAIVSPPDAVAAKAIIHGLRLPRRMVTILEGESLVNDASGLLLYRLAVAAALTGAFSWSAATLSLLWLGCGGVLIGIGAGWLATEVMRFRTHPHEVVLLSFLTAWLTYIGADAVGASGVLAVVACGLVNGWHQHEVLSARARTEARAVWRFTVTVLESLVFVLIGLSLRGVLQRLGGFEAALARAGPLTLAVIAAVVIARFVWIFPSAYLPRKLIPKYRQRSPYPSVAALIVISWAGMRGVVSMAAALALPRSFPGRDLLLFATFGVIAVSVLVQGATLAPLIRALLPELPEERKEALDENAARAAVTQASLKEVESMPAHRESGEPQHPQLIEEYRWRAHVTQRVHERGEEMEDVRHRHFAAALQALTAGRNELIRLHRAGDLHDSTLHAIESELDLEELRLRRLDGQAED